MFISTGSDITYLHMAALNNDIEEMKYQLHHNADPNHADNDGNTPLHYAAYRGHVKMIDMLLDNHAITNTPNNQNQTPYDLAELNNNLGAMRMLRVEGKFQAKKFDF